jgi:hypothetical protein
MALQANPLGENQPHLFAWRQLTGIGWLPGWRGGLSGGRHWNEPHFFHCLASSLVDWAIGFEMCLPWKER